MMAWALRENGSGELERIMDQVAFEGAVVPEIWHVEVANAVRNAVLAKRLPEAEAVPILLDVYGYRIAVDGREPERAFWRTYALAQRHGLSVYDASYLEVAKKRGAALVTFDKELRKAATGEGVAVLPA